MTLVADGDFAVVADADAGLLTPDVRPPRALGGGTDDGAFLGEGLPLGGVGSLAEFAVDFVVIGVGEERVEELVGPEEFRGAGRRWMSCVFSCGVACQRGKDFSLWN